MLLLFSHLQLLNCIQGCDPHHGKEFSNSSAEDSLGRHPDVAHVRISWKRSQDFNAETTDLTEEHLFY